MKAAHSALTPCSTELDTRYGGHIFMCRYHPDDARPLAEKIAKAVEATYPAVTAIVEANQHYTDSPFEGALHTAGAVNEIKLQTSRGLILTSGPDSILVELGGLLRKHPPPNLYVKILDCVDLQRAMSMDDGQQPIVMMECNSQKYFTKFEYDNVVDQYVPDKPVLAFNIERPLTALLKVVLWSHDGSPQDKLIAGVDISVKSLAVNQNKSSRVFFSEATLKLLFRAVAEPFKRHDSNTKSGPVSAPVRSVLETRHDPSTREVLQTSSLPPVWTTSGDVTLRFTDENVQSLFNYFDRDGNGYIDKEEFKELYMSFEDFGHMESLETIDSLIKKYNMLGDDVLSFAEFQILMLKISQR